MEAPRKGGEPRHVIIVCGGAVAGSEAAALAAERGAIVIVLEQNEKPYGKIEDGLPRWHSRLRQKEYERIDANLNRPSIFFVPCTGLGRDVAFQEVRAWAPTSVLLAVGAWRDRALPAAIDAYHGRGLVYQNEFVTWYNHYPEPEYAGPRFEASDDAIVVGGGLASIDVAKILQFELYGRALAERGVKVDVEELDTRGIPEVVQRAGLDLETLGIRGCTLFYRRGMRDMPLVSADEATPEQRARIEVARTKVMDRVLRKYLVRFREHAVPVAPLARNGDLDGLVFRRTEYADGRLVEVHGSEFEVRSRLVVSSIGSIPQPIPGLPTQGELFAWSDPAIGELLPGVYGLGNVLTGRGNIKESRVNAREIVEGLLFRLAGEGPAPILEDPRAHEVRASIEPIVTRALVHPPLAPEATAPILDWVKSRWAAVGYAGNYGEWIATRAR